MRFKTWLLNKLVKYALKEGRKKKVQKVPEMVSSENSDSTMPQMQICINQKLEEVGKFWQIDKKGNCTCPYHSVKDSKKEKRDKRKIAQKVNKGS